MKKPTLKERFLYWFDNHMSKGSISLMRVLIIFTVLFVLILSGAIILFHLRDETEPAGILWDGFSGIINASMPSYEDGTLGYVLIMTLIAIGGLMFTSVLIGLITSAIEEKIMNLKKGNSAVLESGHIVVLGFFPGEYTLIRQLILAAGTSPCTIVIGADEDRENLEQYIKDNVEKPKNVRIICRTVDIFDTNSISRLSINTCKSVIVSPMDDASTTKVLLALSALIDAETNRKVKINAILSKEEHRFPTTLAKKHNVMTLQTNNTLAKIIAHSCTQTGLSEVFKEVFNFEGSELYVISIPDIAGLKFSQLISRLDKAVPLGIYRNYEIQMNPPGDTEILEGDKILVFSETSTTWEFVAEGEEEITERNSDTKPERDTRVLIFGFNESLDIVLSELPENVMKVSLINYDGSDKEYAEIKKICEQRNMEVDTIEGETGDEAELLRICRNAEHIIILSDHEKDEEESDMDTMFLLLALRDLRIKYHLRFNLTAEMRKEANQTLIANDDYTDFIVASNMSSLFLAQLSESPELLSAFREILSNKGNELYMKRAINLNCYGEFTVRQLRRIVYDQGYIMLGYMSSDRKLFSNPPLDQKVFLYTTDSLIVLGEN